MPEREGEREEERKKERKKKKSILDKTKQKKDFSLPFPSLT